MLNIIYYIKNKQEPFADFVMQPRRTNCWQRCQIVKIEHICFYSALTYHQATIITTPLLQFCCILLPICQLIIIFIPLIYKIVCIYEVLHLFYRERSGQIDQNDISIAQL